MKDTYGYLFKVLLVGLLVNPRVDHLQVMRRECLGFFLGQVAKLLIVSDLAHTANSLLPPLLTPLPLSRGGGVLLLQLCFLARLAVSLALGGVRLPDREWFHLLPKRTNGLASVTRPILGCTGG